MSLSPVDDLPPVVLDAEDHEQLESMIQNLKAFKATGKARFFANVCDALQVFGERLIGEPSSSS